MGFTQGSYTANDAVPSRFISVSRVNGSLGPATLVMATNHPARPGRRHVGGLWFGQQRRCRNTRIWSSSINNGYGWRDTDCEYGPNNHNVNHLIPLDLSIFDNKAAQQNLFASLSMLYVYAMDTFSWAA